MNNNNNTFCFRRIPLSPTNRDIPIWRRCPPRTTNRSWPRIARPTVSTRFLDFLIRVKNTNARRWCCTWCRHRPPPVRRHRGLRFCAMANNRRRRRRRHRRYAAASSSKIPTMAGWRTNETPATTDVSKRGWTPCKRTTVRRRPGNPRRTSLLPVPRYAFFFARRLFFTFRRDQRFPSNPSPPNPPWKYVHRLHPSLRRRRRRSSFICIYCVHARWHHFYYCPLDTGLKCRFHRFTTHYVLSPVSIFWLHLNLYLFVWCIKEKQTYVFCILWWNVVFYR